MESRQPRDFPSIERGGHLPRKVHMNTKTMKVFTTYIEPNIIYEFNGVRIVEDKLMPEDEAHFYDFQMNHIGTLKFNDD